MLLAVRIRTRALLVGVLAVALMAGAGIDRADAAQDTSAEQQFVELINGDRAAAGLQTLQSAKDVRDVAYAWSTVMAGERRMYHNPSYHEQFCCWQRAAENVGWTTLGDPSDPAQVQDAVRRLHTAFMNSEGHRANVMHPDHDQIGVGVEVRADSCPNGVSSPYCVWATENFRNWNGTTPAGGLVDPYAGDDRTATTDTTTDVVVSDEVYAGGFDGNHETVERLGATLDSALQLSAARFGADKATHAVLARDDRFPDSLAGSSLTSDGPLLFTPTEGLASSVRDELRRVLPTGADVYLLGGEAALSKAVADAVRGAGFQPVRLAGADRVATALVIADEVRDLYGDTGSVVLARAWGPSDDREGPAAWVDSITGGAWAAAHGSPVLVSHSDQLPSSVARWLDRDRPTSTVLLGGKAALSDAVLGAVPKGTRIAGADRTATAAAVAKILWGVTADSNDRNFVVIDGWTRDGWRHGLAAAGLSADQEAPMLLARGDTADQPTSTTDLMSSCNTPSVDLLLVGHLMDVVAGSLESLDGQTC